MHQQQRRIFGIRSIRAIHHRMHGMAEMAPGDALHSRPIRAAMLGSSFEQRMQGLEAYGGPLTDAVLWRGALFWALALYVPLSGPLGRFEASLADSELTDRWKQVALVISSLLLALAMGLVAQLLMSWALGPGWASSLALIGVGWSLLLALSSSGEGSD
jgi:hypothetical protein